MKKDTHHNINIVSISKEYQQDALRLIFYSPGRYLNSVWKAYLDFSELILLFKHHRLNRQALGEYAEVVSGVLKGQFLFRRLPGPIDSSFMVVSPAVVLIYIVMIVTDMRSGARTLADALRRHPVQSWIIFLFSYSLIVSCLLEIGENSRIRFYTEHLIWVFLALTAFRALVSFNKRLTSPGPTVG